MDALVTLHILQNLRGTIVQVKGYKTTLSTLQQYIDNFSDLSEVVDGKRKDVATLDVAACGTENGKPLAWITVNQTGVVTFHNRNGDKSECTLNNGLKTGSRCNTSDPNPKTSSPVRGSTTAASTTSTWCSATEPKSITTASSSYSPSFTPTSSHVQDPSTTTSSTSTCVCAQNK
ncbi:hypothetical protein PHISP_07802 [Aspergillus sp. HF37]|nr:hypothetical protein PHISP_07802 [Aspergillus sp. HF37]